VGGKTGLKCCSGRQKVLNSDLAFQMGQGTTVKCINEAGDSDKLSRPGANPIKCLLS
jgi:hypothetical protein